MDKASLFRRRNSWTPEFVGPIKSAATTKELLKKVAETGPVKVELHVLFTATAAPASSGPAGRALEGCRSSSVRS